jgi:hypothetical protein
LAAKEIDGRVHKRCIGENHACVLDYITSIVATPASIFATYPNYIYGAASNSVSSSAIHTTVLRLPPQLARVKCAAVHGDQPCETVHDEKGCRCPQPRRHLHFQKPPFAIALVAVPVPVPVPLAVLVSVLVAVAVAVVVGQLTMPLCASCARGRARAIATFTCMDMSDTNSCKGLGVSVRCITKGTMSWTLSPTAREAQRRKVFASELVKFPQREQRDIPGALKPLRVSP